MVDNSKNPIVNSVFNYAKELTKDYHTPQIEFTIKDALNFPFAIKLQRLGRIAIKKSSDDNTNIIVGTIAFVGIAWLIGALFADNKKK